MSRSGAAPARARRCSRATSAATRTAKQPGPSRPPARRLRRSKRGPIRPPARRRQPIAAIEAGPELSAGPACICGAARSGRQLRRGAFGICGLTQSWSGAPERGAAAARVCRAGRPASAARGGSRLPRGAARVCRAGRLASSWATLPLAHKVSRRDQCLQSCELHSWERVRTRFH